MARSDPRSLSRRIRRGLRSVTRRVAGAPLVRRATDVATDAGVRLGVVPYRPENRSAATWSDSYRSGALSFYDALPELARYSIIGGYVGWVSTSVDRSVDLVDVGCGTGVLRGRLATEHLRQYLGVDLSDAAIEQARAGADGDPRTSFLVGDAADLDLGTADVVVLNEMLYYVDPLEPLLRRVEATAAGGHVVVSMWRHPGDRARWAAIDRRWHLVDAVDVRNRSNEINARGWRVGLYSVGPSSAA